MPFERNSSDFTNPWMAQYGSVTLGVVIPNYKAVWVNRVHGGSSKVDEKKLIILGGTSKVILYFGLDLKRCTVESSIIELWKREERPSCFSNSQL